MGARSVARMAHLAEVKRIFLQTHYYSAAAFSIV
jgi:hypothetical protein